MKKKYLLFIVVFCAALTMYAEVVLPKIFSDNMVLQRHVMIPVWGKADVNEKIVVKFNGKTKTIKTDKNGKWIVRLDAESVGGPYELSIIGKNSILIKNV
ncbi:MAG: sialate O-acetylesterase, partial [Saprospiraceae bacterium]